MTQALTLPSIGDLVDGKFRIGRKLGEGGTSTIYEVSHNITDKKFAIKWLLPELALNDAAVERFIHEAKVGGRFVHPHAVQVYDICKANDSFYILMELLEGESLQARLERVGRLSVRDACDILLPCADAVAAAHRAGIIHRDLKPANIFLCSTSEHDEHTSGVRDLRAMRDVPKVLDFGISKLTTRAFGLSPITTTTSTRTVIGTPLYMAPEQMRGEPTDPRTDIYALGIVLYQLVAGLPPFAGENYAELVFKVTVAGRPAPLEEIDGVNAAFAGVVSRAMARDVDERFGSVAELIQALLPYSSLRVGAADGRRAASQTIAFRSREESAPLEGEPEHSRRSRRSTTPDGSLRLGGAVFEGPRIASALNENENENENESNASAVDESQRLLIAGAQSRPESSANAEKTLETQGPGGGATEDAAASDDNRRAASVRRDVLAAPAQLVVAVTSTRSSEITLRTKRPSRGKVAVALPIVLGIGLALAWYGRERIQHSAGVTEHTSYVRPRELSPPTAATPDQTPEPSAVGIAPVVPIGHASVESRSRADAKLRALPSGRASDDRGQKPTRRGGRARESNAQEAEARETKTASPRAARSPDARAEESRDTAPRGNDDHAKAKRASASAPAVDVRLERGDFNAAPPGLTPPEAVVSRNDF